MSRVAGSGMEDEEGCVLETGVSGVCGYGAGGSRWCIAHDFVTCLHELMKFHRFFSRPFAEFSRTVMPVMVLLLNSFPPV